MSKWSIEEALDFAISEEKGAVQFYTELAESVKSRAISAVLRDFANEEQRHKDKLERVKATGALTPVPGKITDLKISDYVVDITPHAGMDYRDALIVAMKKEKAAFKLYTSMAEQIDDENIKNLFLMLAQEEAKHKLRFETEYDDFMSDSEA